MALPDATLTIKDGALGVVPANTNGTQALIGTCSSGVANQVYQFSDITTLKDTLGTGPLVEAAAFVLAIAGGPVVCVKAPSTTAGTNSAVVLTGTGLSVMTLTGAPLDSFQGIVKIITGGTNPASGLATFKYSLDNGKTYSAELAMPTSGVYAIPNTGITLNFSAASLVAGDVYTFTSTGPAYTVSDLNTAMDALLADAQTTWFLVHAVGVPADGAAGLAIFGALDAKMTAAANGYRYARALMNAEDGVRATVKANYANVASTRVVVAYGYEHLTSPINGSAYKRGSAFAVGARASAVPPHEDLGRVATGPVAGINALLHDEFRNPEMDAARFSTLRTIVGRQGYYVTNGRLFSATGSDFQYLQHGRVMDIASATVRSGMLDYLNDSVRVNKTTGLILEADAQSIDARLEAQLRATVTQPGYASDVSARVDRTVNVLSTSKLVVKFRVVPLGYIKTLEGEIGFLNPALQPV